MTGWLYGLANPADPWIAEDKVQHFGWAGFLWLVLERHVAAPLPWFIAAAVAVELVEVWRYRRWVAKGMPFPWPPMTDRISVRDLIVDGLGAFVAYLL
jgi:hypothetical protein